MVSAAMVVKKEQLGCVVSDSPLPTNGRILLDLDAEDIQLKEQFAAGDDFSPKVRKQYTISKQRERWTEEEHTKFLESLRLYGRAWRKIEEHVGTKTAVQIRSHAQKFFSKVVRESNNGDGGEVKPIEIPPPRPKRKPMHPYPRKLVSPVKTGILIPDKLDGTTGMESQSPTSVLSALGSDQSFGGDVCKLLLSEDVISSRSDREEENSTIDEEIPLDSDLSPRKTTFVKRDPCETATQSLKLFGKTFFVMESSGQSCSTQGACKPESVDETVETCLFPLNIPAKTCVDARCASSNGSALQVCSSEKKNDLLYVKITGDTPYLANAGSASHLPWLTLQTEASHSTPEVHSPTPIRAQSMWSKREKLDCDELKEASSTDSVAATARGGNKETSFLTYKLSKKIPGNCCRRGFVPYKRCFTEQDRAPETAEERERQRIRICL